MSRCSDWNNALSGIAKWLRMQGFELDIRCTKGKTDRFIWVEMKKIIHGYCNKHRIKGSYSSRVLLINKDFKSFKDYVLKNKQTTYSKYLSDEKIFGGKTGSIKAAIEVPEVR